MNQEPRTFDSDEEMRAFAEAYGPTLVRAELDVLFDQATQRHQAFMFLDESRAVQVEIECEAELHVVGAQARRYGLASRFEYEPMRGFLEARKIVFSRFPGRVYEEGIVMPSENE